MAEDIKARITIAVGNENAVQKLAEVEAAIKRVTDARRKDMEIARQAATGNGGVAPAPANTSSPSGKPSSTSPSGNGANNYKPPYPGRPADTRPGFNLISPEQNREIERATTNLKDFNDQRLKQLQIQQQINTASTAGNAAQKALEEAKAYETLTRVYERKLATMKAGTPEYRKLATDIERLKVAQQNANGTFLKESIAAEKAKKAITGLSTEKQKNTKHILAARLAAKLFHTEMGDGSLQMIKYGLYVAIAVAAYKLFRFAVEQSAIALERQVDSANSAIEAIRERQRILQEDISEQNNALSVLDNLHEKEKLSAEESLNLQIAIAKLGDGFLELAGGVDAATGKLKNYQQAAIKLKEQQLQDQIADKERELIELRNKYTLIQEKGNSFAHMEKNFQEDFKKGALLVLTGGFVDYTKEESTADYELRKELQRASREISRAEIDLARLRQALEINNKFESQRYSARSQDAKTRTNDAFNSAIKSIASEIGKFQVTAQAAFDANSVEGMRLESRRFINNFQLPKDETLAQVRTIGGDVKLLLSAVNSMKPFLMNTARYTLNLQNNITGTTTYA
jgi:hypothetical protein